MKKIIIIALVTMLGITANAAAVTWTIMNIQSSPSTTASSGWLVQIYANTVTYDYANALTGNITAKFSGQTASGSGDIVYAMQKESDAASKLETVSVFAVIYDASTVAGAKHYIVSGITEKTVPEGGTNITITFGNMGQNNASNMFNNSSWVAVPEPTSGILLLLGAAGLALKRKKA